MHAVVASPLLKLSPVKTRRQTPCLLRFLFFSLSNKECVVSTSPFLWIHWWIQTATSQTKLRTMHEPETLVLELEVLTGLLAH